MRRGAYSIGEFDASGTASLAQQRLPSINNVAFTVTTSPDGDASVDRWVEISTPLSGAALNDPLGIFGGGQLTVRVTMRGGLTWCSLAIAADRDRESRSLC